MTTPWPEDHPPNKPSGRSWHFARYALAFALAFALGGVLGLWLGLAVVKEARNLSKGWKDAWAPLTYAAVGNLDRLTVYYHCGRALGLPDNDDEMKLFAYRGEAQRTPDGWLLLDTILLKDGKAVRLPFACKITGDSVDYMETKAIILKAQQ